ncbi:hypothetical protein DSM101010T_07710 [Desulfovibrio subterraneus]|uniref:Uncharacterized protein n=1 Tax=Desulfovibrio subterraneus TaxID=2718620 RepID=A0A7J0BFH6_9BACT|nr:hypothetical protein DSM101010T_07710 [Desulfovibrio subterraneus]
MVKTRYLDELPGSHPHIFLKSPLELAYPYSGKSQRGIYDPLGISII